MATTRQKIASISFTFKSNSLYSVEVETIYISTSEFCPILITINDNDVWLELNDNRNIRNKIILYHLTEKNMINTTQQIEVYEILYHPSKLSTIISVNIIDARIIENYVTNSKNNKCEFNAYTLLFAPQTISRTRFNIKKNSVNTYYVNTLARDDTKYGLSTSWTFDFKLNFPLYTKNNTLRYITDNAYGFGRLVYNNTFHQFGLEINKQIIYIPSTIELNTIESGYKHIIFTFNNYNKKLLFYIDSAFVGETIVQHVSSLYLLYVYGINTDFLASSNKIKELRYFSWTIEDINILNDNQCGVSCVHLNSSQLCISKSCVWFEISQQCLNPPINCKQLTNSKQECNGEIFSNNNTYDLSHLLQSNCYYDENSNPKSCKIGQNYKLETKEVVNIDFIFEHLNINNMYHCKTFCDSMLKCIHWQYNKIDKKCQLFGNGQYISKMNENYIHGYPLSITGSLIADIISSQIENECQFRSMFHVVIQINYALLYEIFNSHPFIFGLFPRIKFEFAKMNVFSDYGEGGRNIHDDLAERNEISIYWKEGIVDLGWHCYFNDTVTVLMIARDDELDIILFESKLNIQPLISKKMNSWHPINIYDERNNKKNMLNMKIAMFKSCKIDCSADVEMTIYAKHFVTTHPWSFINFEIIYFGQFISTQQHISGSSWNEKIMFKKICKLHNDIKLTPQILIYENFEPVGRELWGIVNDINMDDILSSQTIDNDDSFKNIYVIHSYIKNPIFNGGEYKLQLNMDKQSYIPYLKIKIKVSQIHKSCLIPEKYSLTSVYGHASMANFGIATEITFICTVIILCISIVCFDIKRHSYYKLKKRFVINEHNQQLINVNHD